MLLFLLKLKLMLCMIICTAAHYHHCPESLKSHYFLSQVKRKSGSCHNYLAAITKEKKGENVSVHWCNSLGSGATELVKDQ